MDEHPLSRAECEADLNAGRPSSRAIRCGRRHLDDGELEPRPPYEGWRNYETWAVHLWIASDSTLSQVVRGMARHPQDLTPAEAVESFVEGLMSLVDGSLTQTIVQQALAYVDWESVAAEFTRD